MTQRQFEVGIQKILDHAYAAAKKRLERLQQMQTGARDVHRVRVKAYKVRAYAVREHWRVVSGKEINTRALKAA